MVDIMEEHAPGRLELDLTEVIKRQENAMLSPKGQKGLEFNPTSMKSDRDEVKGSISGYLVKTAQSLSKFQKNQFYRRYYELDIATKQLKIFKNEGSAMKDTVHCAVTHVVTQMRPQLRTDYQEYFTKSGYKNISIKLPEQYPIPFTIFMEDGSMHIFWTGNEFDFLNWTAAFKELRDASPTTFSNMVTAANSPETPLPELTDQNYYVASLYTCLLPESLTRTDIDALESSRQLSSRLEQREEPSSEQINSNNEVIVTGKEIKGWLQKTVQEVGMFQKSRFISRWYILNSHNQTLTIQESEQQTTKPVVIEIRRTRIVHVDTDLSRQLPKNYRKFMPQSNYKEVVLPSEYTQPIGITFSDGSIMLLWARPGKESKVWSRAFKRFQTEKFNQDRTAWWIARQENAFVMGLYLSLISSSPLAVLSNDYTENVQGWLCKTSPNLPANDDSSPFLKAYCILDIKKLQLLLCDDEKNGNIVETIMLSDRLCYMETGLTNKLDDKRSHPIADRKMLEGLRLPLKFTMPFALFFNDGEMELFWAANKTEHSKWLEVFRQLIPTISELTGEQQMTKYCIQSKQNPFITTLYASLERNSAGQVIEEIKAPEPEAQIAKMQGRLFESIQSLAYLDDSADQQILNERYYELDMETEVLKVFHGASMELIDEIFLESRFQTVVSYLEKKLRPDAAEISNGMIQPNTFNALDMLPEESAPFALHFKEGSIMILWAPTPLEQQKWISAFQKLQCKDEQQIWIEMNDDNLFAVTLYKCLMPTLSDEELEAKQRLPMDSLECHARVAESSVISSDGFETNQFAKKFIKLDFVSISIQIFVKERDSEPQQEISLRGKLRAVNTELQNELNPNYRSEFKDDIPVDLPSDEFQFPLALIFEDGEILLIWISTREEMRTWAMALAFIAIGLPPRPQKAITSFLVRSKQNYFTATIYKCLKTKSDESDMPQIPKLPINQAHSTLDQQEEEESKVEQVDHDQVSGFLSRTSKGNLTIVDEPFLYRFYRLDINTGVLSEFLVQDQQKARKLVEYQLLRKVIWVETNISNKLRPDYQHIFRKYSSDPGAGFALPDEKMRPIALHMVDGDILLFWMSARREFDKWLTAFKNIQIPTLERDSRQLVHIKVTASNCYTVSTFQSILPKEKAHRQNMDDIGSPARRNPLQLQGWCNKTAQSLSMMQKDFVFKRFYIIDIAAKKLMISKKQGAKAKDSREHDLSQLEWIDSTLSNKYKEGYRSICKSENNQDFNFANASGTVDTFSQANVFQHPVALGFNDGDYHILWFEKADDQQKVAETLQTIVNENEQVTFGQKYLISTPANEFLTTLYRVLKPMNPEDGDPRIIFGKLGRALTTFNSKLADMFTDQFLLLDTRTGVLSFYTNNCFREPDEWYELSLVRFIPLMEQETNSIKLNYGALEIKWSPEQKPFALHNGGMLRVFMAPDQQSYDMWSKAFKSLQITKYSNLELWVNNLSQDYHHVEFVQALQPLMQTQQKPNGNANLVKLKGYLCKTAQAQHSQTKKMFYKRFYTLDPETKTLSVSLKEGDPIKETFNLNDLVQVDDELNRSLCVNYRAIFKSYFSGKIILPKEFAYPFALKFRDGSVQLFWISSQELYHTWIKALKTFVPEWQRQNQIFIRYPGNYFVCTLYMCLKREQPSIVRENKFEEKKLGEDQYQDPDKVIMQEDKEVLLDTQALNFEAMTSARGIIEGELYKTSQKSSFFQLDTFFIRYYRLNLMTEELKIFDKPDGNLKGSLKLSQRVFKVDCALRQEITPADIKKLGSTITLPCYKYPFAIFTDKECMLLWAADEKDRDRWVEGFETIKNKTAANQWSINKTKQNKLVIGLYECLKQDAPLETDMKKRSKTTQPTSRREPAKDSLVPPQQDQSRLEQAQDETAMPDLSNQKEEQKSPIIQKTRTAKAVEISSETKNPSPSILKTNEGTVNSQPKVQAKIVLKKPALIAEDEPEKTQSPKILMGHHFKENNEHSTDPMPGSPVISKKQHIRGRSLRLSNKNSVIKVKETTEQTQILNSNRNNMLFEENPDVSYYPQKMNLMGLKPNDSVPNIDLGAEKLSRQGRRYRAQSGVTGSTNGPIKIKKLVNTGQLNAQSMAGIFSGKTQVQSSQSNFQSMTIENNDSVEDDDDDIDRDPAAEIIRPTFRRSFVTQRDSKIKVKIRGRESFQSSNKQSDGGRFNYRQAIDSAHQPQVDFEDKVKGQIDHQFIDTLIQNAGDRTQLLHKRDGTWGGIADSLRSKIKLSAQNQQINTQAIKPPAAGPTPRIISDAGSGPIKAISTVATNLYSTRQPEQKQQPTELQIPKPMAMRQSVQQVHEKRADGDISDWDDSSEDDRPKHGRNAKSQVTTARQIVNVRDRTLGLSNVFSGQDMADRMSKDFKKPNAFTSSYQNNNQYSNVINQAEDPADQIDEDIIIPHTEANPYDNPMPGGVPNENDCIAESFNSVWD